eukprot:424124_1
MRRHVVLIHERNVSGDEDGEFGETRVTSKRPHSEVSSPGPCQSAVEALQTMFSMKRRKSSDSDTSDTERMTGVSQVTHNGVNLNMVVAGVNGAQSDSVQDGSSP